MLRAKVGTLLHFLFYHWYWDIWLHLYICCPLLWHYCWSGASTLIWDWWAIIGWNWEGHALLHPARGSAKVSAPRRDLPKLNLVHFGLWMLDVVVAIFGHCVTVELCVIFQWNTIQELSYRKQIGRQLRTQYVESIYRPKYYTVTLNLG